MDPRLLVSRGNEKEEGEKQQRQTINFLHNKGIHHENNGIE
jgi:hypothetical protein